jgi:hypothetical protein
MVSPKMRYSAQTGGCVWLDAAHRLFSISAQTWRTFAKRSHVCQASSVIIALAPTKTSSAMRMMFRYRQNNKTALLQLRRLAGDSLCVDFIELKSRRAF